MSGRCVEARMSATAPTAPPANRFVLGATGFLSGGRFPAFAICALFFYQVFIALMAFVPLTGGTWGDFLEDFRNENAVPFRERRPVRGERAARPAERRPHAPRRVVADGPRVPAAIDGDARQDAAQGGSANRRRHRAPAGDRRPATGAGRDGRHRRPQCVDETVERDGELRDQSHPGGFVRHECGVLPASSTRSSSAPPAGCASRA